MTCVIQVMLCSHRIYSLLSYELLVWGLSYPMNKLGIRLWLSIPSVVQFSLLQVCICWFRSG